MPLTTEDVEEDEEEEEEEEVAARSGSGAGVRAYIAVRSPWKP